jgi:hypothetical protein
MVYVLQNAGTPLPPANAVPETQMPTANTYANTPYKYIEKH